MAEPIISKRCPRCKEIKPISEFFKRQQSKDRLQYKCKTCCLQYNQSEKGRVANRKAKKKYNKTPKGKATKKKYERTPKGKAVKKRFKARHPNQIKAKNAVNHAITAGKLPRPDTLLCHYCPKPAQQYHHWHGYEPKHWLDVIPVCILCHHN